MEKIITQNKDELTIKYYLVSLVSLLTFKKWKSMEKSKLELRDLLENLEIERDDKKL